MDINNILINPTVDYEGPVGFSLAKVQSAINLMFLILYMVKKLFYYCIVQRLLVSTCWVVLLNLMFPYNIIL